MSYRKRKRHYKDIKCVFFPDDVENGLQKVGAASLSSVSSAKSWEKCGDSFLDTPVIKSLKSSGRKLSAVRKLSQSSALVQTGADCNEDPVHIAWSSSDSERSDDETQKQHLSRVVSQQQQRPQRPGRPTAPIQSYTRALRMLRTDKDDLPVIDTDSDLDESEEDAEKDSGQQISDCESESFDEKLEDLPLKPTNMTELEISGYVSDGENNSHTVTSSRLESFPLQTGEGSKRSVSDWVRSAQAMLQTPQKPLARQSKTPEDFFSAHISKQKRPRCEEQSLTYRAERVGGGGVCFSGLFWSWSEAAVDSSCWEFGLSVLWNIQAGGSGGASSVL